MQEPKMDKILQEISVLALGDQEFIVDTMIHRINDSKRTKLLSRAKEAEKNYQSGDFSSGTAKELMRSLNDA